MLVQSLSGCYKIVTQWSNFSLVTHIIQRFKFEKHVNSLVGLRHQHWHCRFRISYVTPVWLIIWDLLLAYPVSGTNTITKLNHSGTQNTVIDIRQSCLYVESLGKFSGGPFWLNQLLWKISLTQEKPEVRQHHKMTQKSREQLPNYFFRDI